MQKQQIPDPTLSSNNSSEEEILDDDNPGETIKSQDIQDVFYTASAKAYNPADHDQAQALQEALKVIARNIREMITVPVAVDGVRRPGNCLCETIAHRTFRRNIVPSMIAFSIAIQIWN